MMRVMRDDAYIHSLLRILIRFKRQYVDTKRVVPPDFFFEDGTHNCWLAADRQHRVPLA